MRSTRKSRQFWFNAQGLATSGASVVRVSLASAAPEYEKVCVGSCGKNDPRDAKHTCTPVCVRGSRTCACRRRLSTAHSRLTLPLSILQCGQRGEGRHTTAAAPEHTTAVYSVKPSSSNVLKENPLLWPPLPAHRSPSFWPPRPSLSTGLPGSRASAVAKTCTRRQPQAQAPSASILPRFDSQSSRLPCPGFARRADTPGAET